VTALPEGESRGGWKLGEKRRGGCLHPPGEEGVGGAGRCGHRPLRVLAAAICLNVGAISDRPYKEEREESGGAGMRGSYVTFT